MTKTNRKFLIVLAGSIFILFPSCKTHKAGEGIAADDSGADRIPISAPSVQYPAEQMLFHQANLRYREQLTLAKNDAQRSEAVDGCDKSRSKFFKERKLRVSHWVGKIAEVRNENKGAWMFLRIVSDAAGFIISYQTHYQRWPTWKQNSIVEKGSKSYQQASKLSVGQMVSFSGTFIESLY